MRSTAKAMSFLTSSLTSLFYFNMPFSITSQHSALCSSVLAATTPRHGREEGGRYDALMQTDGVELPLSHESQWSISVVVLK